MSLKNLDVLSAQHAQNMVTNAKGAMSGEKRLERIENLATKSMGVIQESGIYAGTLFLYTRNKNDKPGALAILDELLALSGKVAAPLPVSASRVPLRAAQTKEVLVYVANDVCAHLDRVLLVKQVWEQALTYCRYGAKAEKAGAEK